MVDIISTLDQGKDGDDEGSTETPGDGNQNPEGEVALGEHSSRYGKEGPDEDQNQSQGVTTAGNPALGTAQQNWVLFFGGQTTHILLDEGDVLVKLGEVVILGINEHRVDVVDDGRGEDSDQVTRKHDFVGTESGNANFTRLDLGGNDPTNNGQNKSDPSGDDGTGSGGLLPGHEVPQGNDGGSDNDTHEKVDPSKVQSDFVQDDGQDTHHQSEGNDDDTGNKEDLFSGGFGVHVLTVDVVGNEGRHGDGFSGSGGHDGHEKHDQNQDGSGLSEEFGGDGGGYQTRSGFSGGDGKLEGGGGQSKGGGKREGNGEPANSEKIKTKILVRKTNQKKFELTELKKIQQTYPPRRYPRAAEDGRAAMADCQ